MSEHINNNKSEKLMEAYYKYIGECHIENIVSELEDKRDEIGQIQISESLDKWFEKYSNERKKREKQLKRKKQVKIVLFRVAVIAVLLIASLSVVTFSIEAMRVRVLNFFMETHEKYTIVRVEEDHTLAIPWDDYYYPTYLPESFILVSAEKFNATKIIQFTNNEGKFITFTQAPNGTEFQLDTEDGNIIELMINNETGILIEKGGRIILFWNNFESSFYLLSNIGHKDIVRIAESIEKK